MKLILYLLPLAVILFSLLKNYLSLRAYKKLGILGLSPAINMTKSEKDAIHLTQIAQYGYQQNSAKVLVIISISLTLLYCAALLTKVSLINDIDLSKLEKLIGIIGGISLSGTSLYFWHQATKYYNEAISKWNEREN